jgi:hypothetical protein
MKLLKLIVVLAAVAVCFGTARDGLAQADGHSHGTGPNRGVVFDLGANHAEFLVDHAKQQCQVLILDADGKAAAPIVAEELVLITKDTKTADGKGVPAMTIVLLPTDASQGKAAKFVGTDPGIANVADFAGTVTGEIDGKPASGEFDEAAAGHPHTPHDGMVATLRNADGAAVGFVELKLHDDKGDLELWIAKDPEMTQPIDIPAKSEIEVTFLDLKDKAATLRVRNHDQNEDEDGQPNLRDGLTNYFIFPGDSGQDPSWLMGKDFASNVELSFDWNGQTYKSNEFKLVPHTHADGHGHSH